MKIYKINENNRKSDNNNDKVYKTSLIINKIIEKSIKGLNKI